MANGTGKSIWDLSTKYAEENRYVTTTSGTSEYPGRWVTDGGNRRWHTGEGLVNSQEKFVRNPDGSIKTAYNLDVEPGMFLAGLSPSERVLVMKQLANAGFISPSSIGDYAAEMRAITNAMETANFSGLDWSTALQRRLSGGPVVSSGGAGARRYSTTSPDDLKTIGNKVAQSTLGREFTREEADKFVQAYQQQEIGAQRAAYGGGTFQQAPAVDVAAEKFARETAPQEAAGYDYLGYINQLFGSIGVG